MVAINAAFALLPLERSVLARPFGFISGLFVNANNPLSYSRLRLFPKKCTSALFGGKTPHSAASRAIELPAASLSLFGRLQTQTSDYARLRLFPTKRRFAGTPVMLSRRGVKDADNSAQNLYVLHYALRITH